MDSHQGSTLIAIYDKDLSGGGGGGGAAPDTDPDPDPDPELEEEDSVEVMLPAQDGLGSGSGSGGGYNKKKVGRPITSPRTMAQNFPPVPEIRDKLENGECYVRTRTASSSSDVWSVFEEVAYTATQEFTGIVRCKACGFMTRYHGQITGTSHMRRHSCFLNAYPEAAIRSVTPKGETNRKGNFATKKFKKDLGFMSTEPGSSLVASPAVWDRFSEVRDIASQEFVGYVTCKNCKVLVKCDSQAINSHLCKQKDVDKSSLTPNFNSNLMFRSKPRNRATPIWDDFEEVIDPTSNAILGYVRCKNCKEIVKATDPKSVPAVLRRHQSHCSMMTGSSALTMTPLSEIKSEPTDGNSAMTITPITAGAHVSALASQGSSSGTKIVNAKLDFRDRCIQFCFSELVGLEAVTSESFRRLAQSIMSLGAQYGRSTLVLPDCTQLSTQLSGFYTLSKNQIKTELNLALRRNIGGALVCDSQDELCILSVFFINANWQLVESVLSATTAENDINAFITTTLSDYGLNEEELLKFTFVSRGGLFDGVNVCLTSVAHTIDQVIESSIFADDTYTDVIENCKLICSELKLEVPAEKVVTGVEWMVKFELMRMVVDNQDKFELKNLTLDMELVKFMVDLLGPFKNASLELRQSSKHATINHVLLWYYRLLKVLSPGSEDEEGEQSYIHSMKTALKAGMEHHFHLHSIHKVAAFLWPNFRFLKMLSSEERDIVHQEVRTLIENRLVSGEEYQNPTKKARSDFSDWEDITDSEQDEVSKYVSAMLTSCSESDLLTWWKEHQNDFPRLSHLAKWILSIPASVTSLEKYKLSSAHKVDEQLLFLHCNADLGTKLSSMARFSSIVKVKPLHTSWKQKMELRSQRKSVKLRDEEMKAVKQLALEQKKRRREETRKRKEENTRKAEIVQKITNSAKLKRKSKKEMRKLRKA